MFHLGKKRKEVKISGSMYCTIMITLREMERRSTVVEYPAAGMKIMAEIHNISTMPNHLRKKHLDDARECEENNSWQCKWLRIEQRIIGQVYFLGSPIRGNSTIEMCSVRWTFWLCWPAQLQWKDCSLELEFVQMNSATKWLPVVGKW